MTKYNIRAGSCTLSEHVYGDKTPDRELLPGERAIGNLIIPSFQRQAIWSEKQQVRLIDSLLSGLPIGGIIINRVNDFKHECCDLLIDGQQRMTAISAFFNNELEVNGLFFIEMEKKDQLFFKTTAIPRAISELQTLEECEELYNRIAYGGTEHNRSQYLER